MLQITGAHYIDRFRIRVQFNNGDEGVVDLCDSLWGPMFEPLRDPMVFRRFEVSNVLHTIKWENDADFSSRVLTPEDGRTIASTGAGGRAGFKWRVVTAGPVMRDVRC